MKMLFVFLAMLAIIAIVGGYVPPEENIELAFGVEIDDMPVTQEEVHRWVDDLNSGMLNFVLWAVVLVLVALGLIVLFGQLFRPVYEELDIDEKKKSAIHKQSLRDVQEQKYSRVKPYKGKSQKVYMPAFYDFEKDEDFHGKYVHTGTVDDPYNTPLERDGKSDWLG